MRRLSNLVGRCDDLVSLYALHHPRADGITHVVELFTWQARLERGRLACRLYLARQEQHLDND